MEEVTTPPRQHAQPIARLVVQTQPGWLYDDQTGKMYRVGHQSRGDIHGRAGADNPSAES